MKSKFLIILILFSMCQLSFSLNCKYRGYLKENNKEYTYITYHVLVPFGRTNNIELLFQKLAGSAGVDFEVK